MDAPEESIAPPSVNPLLLRTYVRGQVRHRST